MESPDCNCLTLPNSGTESFHVFSEGDELYKAMLLSINNAKECIRLETYIFANDIVGNQFCDALVERARAGISVRIHIDAAGSLFWFSRKMENYLRSSGVQLRWFHRWSWRKPWRYNRRNHRKLLIIDDSIAYLGGFNIHRECSRNYYGDIRWRDTHVSFDGLLVTTAAQIFDEFWRGNLYHLPKQEYSGSQLLHNHTLKCRYRLRCAFAEAFSNARQTIYLTTPYLVPDRHILKCLRDAAERGIDVRLLVPRRSDVQIARWAARYTYTSLLGSDVKIYEYLPRVLHAKTLVIDGSWSMIGTANLDYRSFFTNYELNLASTNAELSSRLNELFIKDLQSSERIGFEFWKGRPWVYHIAEYLANLIRHWL